MTLIEIIPTFPEKSNPSYGIRYENQLVELSLMNIEGLNLIDDPNIYLEQERCFTSLKMVPVEKNKKTEKQIEKEVTNSLFKGEFYILPGIFEKTKIIFNQQEYYIKFDGKYINLYDNTQKNISNQKLNIIYNYNSHIKCNNYYFDLSTFFNLYNSTIMAIGDFDEYFLFLFKSVMENDGLFIAKNKFLLSDFKINVIFSYNKNDKNSFEAINKNSFIVYETKSNNDFKGLLKQMIQHSDYISKFLFYFRKKFSIENPVYYLGFIKENSNVPINIDDNFSLINTLKSKDLNIAVLQIKDSIFEEKIIFSNKNYQKINNIESNILEINKKLNEGLKRIDGQFNNIGVNFNNIENNFKDINQNFKDSDDKSKQLDNNFTNINDNFNNLFDKFEDVDIQIKGLDAKIKNLDVKVDNQFKNVDNQFKNVDNKFKNIDNKLNNIDNQLISLKDQINTNNETMKEMINLLNTKKNNENEVSQTNVNNDGNNGNIGNPNVLLNLLIRALIEPTIKDIIAKNFNK